jgi:hypothetical protein
VAKKRRPHRLGSPPTEHATEISRLYKLAEQFERERKSKAGDCTAAFSAALRLERVYGRASAHGGSLKRPAGGTRYYLNEIKEMRDHAVTVAGGCIRR